MHAYTQTFVGMPLMCCCGEQVRELQAALADCDGVFSKPPPYAQAQLDVAQRQLLRVQELAPLSARVQLLYAQLLLAQKKYAESSTVCAELLRADASFAEALYVRARALYYQSQFTAAVAHLRNALQLDPDNQRYAQAFRQARNIDAKKKEGNDAFAAGRSQEAFDLYTEALAIDPLHDSFNAQLYANRAAAALKLGKHQQAVDDCTAAIERDETYNKAYLRRAQVRVRVPVCVCSCACVRLCMRVFLYLYLCI